jgi:superfamily II DNA or RNA helicase
MLYMEAAKPATALHSEPASQSDLLGGAVETLNIRTPHIPQGTLVLRPHQARLLDNIDHAISDGATRIMVQAPTGFGKTIIAGEIANAIVESGRRAIFTVPALSLIDQTVERLHGQGIHDIGVIQGKHPLTNPDSAIQVASVQTLARRQMPPADMVLIDEAHIWFSKWYPQWLCGPWRHIPVVGLSATPWTRGLGRHFDQLIVGSTTAELIKAGYLSDFRVFAPASPDLTGVRILAGDYHERDLGEVMNRPGLVADVVATWLARARGRPTLCFAVDRLHASHLQKQFLAAGVAAAYVDAYTPRHERDEIGKRFSTGEIQVVCNVGCLTTGIDWDVRCIILARPTRSEMLFVQMIGRGLRTAEGKADCLVLDHSDNHLRLGFVTDIHHEELDTGHKHQRAPARSKAALPQKCPECAFLKPPKVAVCPSCGFKSKPICDIVNQEGELIELSSRRAVKVPTLEEKRCFYAEVRHICRDRGYKDGWAAHKYKEKFGEWPRREWNDDPTAKPNKTTLDWVKSQFIAYAKRRDVA